MEHTYWYKQTVDSPLFPDFLWSRPENKATAGKLLIIGGNLHGFAAPSEAYARAAKTGIGMARVLLPDATKQMLGPVMENGDFAPSTPSGSFSKAALSEFLDHASWADAVLLAGELGRNSETAIVLEQFTLKHDGLLAITRDAVDYFKGTPATILNRPNTVLVLSTAQLQKLCTAFHHPVAITLGMDLIKLVDVLHQLTLNNPIQIITKHLENLVVASKGKVSTTKLINDMPMWRVKTAASASVWWLQNPTKPFEALTTAIYDLNIKTT